LHAPRPAPLLPSPTLFRSSWKVSISPVEHTPPQETEKRAGTDAHTRHYQYFVILIEDLTELRRLERVRRDFIANISHELRTPLADRKSTRLNSSHVKISYA